MICLVLELRLDKQADCHELHVRTIRSGLGIKWVRIKNPARIQEFCVSVCVCVCVGGGGSNLPNFFDEQKKNKQTKQRTKERVGISTYSVWSKSNYATEMAL